MVGRGRARFWYLDTPEIITNTKSLEKLNDIDVCVKYTSRSVVVCGADSAR